MSAVHAALSENKGAMGQNSSDTGMAEEARGWQLCNGRQYKTAEVKPS